MGVLGSLLKTRSNFFAYGRDRLEPSRCLGVTLFCLELPFLVRFNQSCKEGVLPAIRQWQNHVIIDLSYRLAMPRQFFSIRGNTDDFNLRREIGPPITNDRLDRQSPAI